MTTSESSRPFTPGEAELELWSAAPKSPGASAARATKTVARRAPSAQLCEQQVRDPPKVDSTQDEEHSQMQRMPCARIGVAA